MRAQQSTNSEAQGNLGPVGGDLQIDAALVIGGNGRVEVEQVKGDGAPLAVDAEGQIARREHKSPNFQSLSICQDEYGRR